MSAPSRVAQRVPVVAHASATADLPVSNPMGIIRRGLAHTRPIATAATIGIGAALLVAGGASVPAASAADDGRAWATMPITIHHDPVIGPTPMVTIMVGRTAVQVNLDTGSNGLALAPGVAGAEWHGSIESPFMGATATGPAAAGFLLDPIRQGASRVLDGRSGCRLQRHDLRHRRAAGHRVRRGVRLMAVSEGATPFASFTTGDAPSNVLHCSDVVDNNGHFNTGFAFFIGKTVGFDSVGGRIIMQAMLAPVVPTPSADTSGAGGAAVAPTPQLAESGANEVHLAGGASAALAAIIIGAALLAVVSTRSRARVGAPE